MAGTSSAMTPTASLRVDHPDRLAVEPGADVLDGVGEILPVILLADIAEMRRDHDIAHLAERMIERQRLDVEHIDAGAGNSPVLQRRDQRPLVDDRTT